MSQNENRTGHSKKMKSLQQPSKISLPRSQKSQLPPKFLDPCDSHQFLLKPLPKCQSSNIREKIHFYFSHQNPNLPPYITLLTEFKGEEYMPCFGFAIERQRYIRNRQKYKQFFNGERKKLQDRAARKSPIKFAIPKHVFCQVCKHSFEDYEEHINSSRHKKNLRQSEGASLLEELIGQLNAHIESFKGQNFFQPIDEVIESFNKLCPVIDKKFDNYSSQKLIPKKKIVVR